MCTCGPSLKPELKVWKTSEFKASSVWGVVVWCVSLPGPPAYPARPTTFVYLFFSIQFSPVPNSSSRVHMRRLEGLAHGVSTEDTLPLYLLHTCPNVNCDRGFKENDGETGTDQLWSHTAGRCAFNRIETCAGADLPCHCIPAVKRSVSVLAKPLWRELPRHRYLAQKTSSDDSALQETALPKISKQPPRPTERVGV